MDEAKLYWTILVAFVSAGWMVIAFIRDRMAQSVALSSALVTRLMEYDTLNIENPDIQKFISRNTAREEKYFRSEKLLEEKLRHPFYRSIMNHEKHIFGVSLRDFWIRNREGIESNPADPFIW